MSSTNRRFVSSSMISPAIIWSKALTISAASLVLASCSCESPKPNQGLGDASLDGTLRDGSPNRDGQITVDTGNGDTGNSGDASSGAAVKVVMTADNAYGFGWGSSTQIASYFGRPEVVGGGDTIFDCPIGQGPEAYEIPADQARSDAYVYLIAWNDRDNTQGVLGQFYRQGSPPLYTGDAAWEVCATGREYNIRVSGEELGPEEAEINQEILRCNAGTGDRTQSSAGWVKRTEVITANALGRLEVGEDNSTALVNGEQNGNEFPIACQMDSNGNQGIDAAAKWMWYRAPDDEGNPFRWSSSESSAHPGGNYTRQFLIFRVPVQEIIIL